MKTWGEATWQVDGSDRGSAPWQTDLDLRLVGNEAWCCAQCGTLWARVTLRPDPGKWHFNRADCRFHDRTLISSFPGQLLNTQALTASAPRAILLRELQILAERNGHMWPMIAYRPLNTIA